MKPREQSKWCVNLIALNWKNEIDFSGFNDGIQSVVNEQKGKFEPIMTSNRKRAQASTRFLWNPNFKFTDVWPSILTNYDLVVPVVLSKIKLNTSSHSWKNCLKSNSLSDFIYSHIFVNYSYHLLLLYIVWTLNLIKELFLSREYDRFFRNNQ